MGSDSIANASIPVASSNAKEFSKKKRGNRSAKLKQCKLDARREQWLSQVKNKGGKEDLTGEGGMTNGASVRVEKDRVRAIEKLEISPRADEENDGSLLHNYSDLEPSPSNSPTSHTSSMLGSNDSGTNFTGSSSSSRSSSSGGCFSGTMSEEDEEEDDGGLDDWEAVADALAATDDKQEEEDQEHQQKANSGLHAEENNGDSDNVSQLDSCPGVINHVVSGIDITKPKPKSKPKPESSGDMRQRTSVSCRAWRPDDAFRPQSLPNLSKQYSFPNSLDRHYGSVWGCENPGAAPTACPICFEDLDFTDSSFLPCACGFRLCLFCHKRIVEEDGRCPGCRKQYHYDPVEGEATLDGGSLTYRLGRSCSMVLRS